MTGVSGPAGHRPGLAGLLGGYEIVDLSLPLAENLPCHWPTHQPFQHKIWNWFADRRTVAGDVYNRGGPYATRWLLIDEHTGTHMDAPSHFVPPPDSGLPDACPAGAIGVADVDPAQLTGPAAVIAVPEPATGQPGISQPIEPDTVLDWEKVNGRLAGGDVVLFHTGWDRRYLPGADGAGYLAEVVVTGRAPGWPAPSIDTMELLMARGVRCVGTDTPSMGPAQDARGVHIAGLRTGAVYVECLSGLEVLPATGALFCFLPLRLTGGTGSPGRAIAFVRR